MRVIERAKLLPGSTANCTIFLLCLLCFIITSLAVTVLATPQTRRPSQKTTTKPQTQKRDKHYKFKSKPKQPTAKARRIPAPLPQIGQRNTTGARAREEQEEIAERKRWFIDQRAYPERSLKISARKQAWRKSQSQKQAQQKTEQKITDLFAEGHRWQTLGPQPTRSAFLSNWGKTSGRINTIAISPEDANLVLIGSATGGIWRSHDGGETFVPVSDNQADLAVGSLAFADSDAKIVYAGMGDAMGGYLGSGVLKSTDAGLNWQSINNNSLPSPGTVAKIAVDPANANLVYLAQSDTLIEGKKGSSGFFRSTDGGVNWTRTLAGLARDIVINPANPEIIYLAMSRVDEAALPAGVYRSNNRGLTWQIIYAPKFPNGAIDIRLAISPADANRIYIYAGGFNSDGITTRVEVSTNGGENFTNLGNAGLDTRQFGFNTFITADPFTANTVYVGTVDLYRSTNGGQSWQNLTNSFSPDEYHPELSNTHPDQHTLTFLPGSSTSFLLGNDGGLARTTDGGLSFRTLNDSLSLTQFVAYTVDSRDALIALGGSQDNGTQQRQGNSLEWQELLSGDGGRAVIDARNSGLFYTSYIFGTVYRFNNGQFEKQITSEANFGEPAFNPRIAFYPPLVGNNVNSQLYFGTWRLFTSLDQGESWFAPADKLDLTKGITAFGADVLNVIAVATANTDVIYTGSSQGRVMVSRDGGRTYQDITAGLPNRAITGIIIDPADPARAYLSVSGFGSGHIFLTENFGADWRDISGDLPDVPTNALMLDPTDRTVVYAGTDLGVFRSQDHKFWVSLSNNMPPVIVTALASQPSGLVQAATFGRGVFELTRINSGDTDFALAVTPMAQQLIAGQQAVFTIGAQPINGFSLPISLSAISSENSIKLDLPTTISPGRNVSLTATVPAELPPGVYNLSITGSVNNTIRSRNVVLTIVAPTRPIQINAVQYRQQRLSITGNGFGADARVSINGQEISNAKQTISDGLITLKGQRRKLNLRKGDNQITVTSQGSSASTVLKIKR